METKKGFTCNLANLQQHLINAYLTWLRDEGDDPYLLVDATWPGVDVPQHVITAGQVILNLAIRSTQYVNVEKDAVFVGCRFGGRHYDVVVPNGAIRAVYGYHSKMGTVWPESTERPVMQSMVKTDHNQQSKTDNGVKRPNPFSVVK